MAEYRLRFDRIWAVANTLLFAGPRRSRLAIEGDTLVVRYGWLFRADIPLGHILVAEARMRFPRWSGIGVHVIGRRRWVVNGSRRGAVRLALDRVPARSGPFRVVAEELWLSVEDRDRLLGALRGDTPPR